MGNWYPSHGNGPERFSVLGGVLVGGLLVGLVWAITGVIHQSSGTDQTTVSDQGASTAASTDTTGATGNAGGMSGMGNMHTVGQAGHVSHQGVNVRRLSRCRQVYAAQSVPMAAAAASMDQWQVHIGAMNKLVVGAITWPQATAFWNQTRVGAASNLAAFKKAMANFGQRQARCPTKALTLPSGGQLGSCVHAVMGRNDVLSLARVSLHTWGTHIMHMDMLRNGQMTPAQASAAWLRSWHAGQEEVIRYRHALKNSSGRRC